MHRWFFANEREECEPVKPVDADGHDLESVVEEELPPPVPTTDWPFCVIYDKPLEGNEYIGVTGNCDSLGNWDPKKVYILGRKNCRCSSNCGCRRFEVEITIPRNIDIEYRYCVVAYDPVKDDRFIRFWEVHRKPRIIRTCQNMLKDCDRFGYQPTPEPDYYKVDRGWATTESYVHFKIFNAPFQWQRQRPRLLYVHIQPMYNAPLPICPEGVPDSIRMSINSRMTRVLNLEEKETNTQVAYTEVVNLADCDPLHFQDTVGLRCGRTDLSMYHCSIADLEHTLYRLDLYTYAYKAAPDEPAYHYGYGFVQPEQLTGSEGYVRIKITCASTHRPLIEMSIRYLIIRPLPNYRCDLRLTYERYWRQGHLPLDIGHRGAGTTYRHNQDVHRENTLYGFKQAHVHRADLIEFDVQLTKDARVVIYHDQVMKFGLQRCPQYEELLEVYDVLVFPHEWLSRLKLLQLGACKRADHIAMPFEAFNYEQLKLVRVIRFAENEGCEVSCERMLHEQSPFVLLSDLFDPEKDAMPDDLGYNIEIKWTQLDSTKRWENDGFRPSFDRNFYVDTILELVLENAGARRIMFSCFDADICAMVRYKQNRYPVLLLTSDPDREVQYFDQRVRIMSNAMHLSYALEFFGLGLHSTSLLQKPSLIAELHELSLHAVAWGGINVDVEVRDQLKSYGIMGIIYDRIDQLDQAGEQLYGNLCLIDNMATRRILETLEKAEWKIKCGYTPKAADW